MKQRPAMVLAFVLAFALAFASLASHAARVDIVGGDFPQVARAYTFFEHTIVVRVRDDAGRPQAGAMVFYSFDEMGEFDPGVINFLDGPPVTDANGLARFDFAANQHVGAIHLTFHSNSASRRLAPLFAIGEPPTATQLVSGGDQTAAVGEEFDHPWVVRAVDRYGRPVPNAVVIFYADSDLSAPLVTLDGGVAAVARADHRGYARSPKPVAGLVTGAGVGGSSGLDQAGTPIYYTITP
jgi:hypothetical protein